jgi:hypothetical protein
MKKFFYLLMMPVFLLTSCDTDTMIADYLTTGNWEGYMGTYYTNRWGDAFQDGEYHTVWRFNAAGYDNYGAATYGTGYEVDYSTSYRNEYAFSSFRWEVHNGNINITYDDPSWNPIRIDWRHYSISRSRFSGTMYDWENRIYEFDMTNYASWDWDYYNRYWSRTRSATDADAGDVYISDNGKSIATGRFAEAMKKLKASR